MERLRALWKGEQDYEPIGDDTRDGAARETSSAERPAFSYMEYSIFLLLGISMLWAWNMFLAAGPYFQSRFADSPWILEHFQAAEISVSTVTNLGAMLILTRLQVGASYPKRIIASLIINMITFTLLAASTKVDIGATGYFAFLMLMILSASLATGLCQNGIFAYVSGFGEPRYTQGIMTGQAIAGVLPCIAQIVSVLAVHPNPQHSPRDDKIPLAPGAPPVNPNSALAYFLTATIISVITLLAFLYLVCLTRQPQKTLDSSAPDLNNEPEERKAVSMRTLFRKLFWLASAVFVTFAVTMMFPVFTQRITSVRKPQDQPPILQPPSFIPLAFLMWNIGDLVGRLLTAIPLLTLTHRPRALFVLSTLRVGFVGLYYLCNIRGAGALVQSDAFYLVAVQLLFGITNGYTGSTAMIGAAEWVDPEEREAAGGFMGLCLCIGLAVGSLASFFVPTG